LKPKKSVEVLIYTMTNAPDAIVALLRQALKPGELQTAQAAKPPSRQ
jgi:hypothetical protein